jgi:hypothetical protein
VQNPFFQHMPPNAATSTLNNSKLVTAWVLMGAFPQFNQTLFSNTEPVGWGDYNSMQMKINKRFTSGEGFLVNGLSFLTSFTWSKTMVANSLVNNNNSQCPGCVDISAPGTDRLTPFIPSPQYQLSSNDRTLDFALSGIYGLPFGKGGLVGKDASGMLGQVLNDWSFDWIFTDSSGTPIQFSNTVSFNCPQNGNSLLPARRNWNEWLYNETPSCFSNLASNTWIPRLPNPRQSIVRNPWAPQVAFGLQKGFKVTERVNLQFKAEAFNATNTPIFGGPSTSNQTAAIKPVFFTNPANGQKTQILPGQPGAFTGYGTIGSTQQNFPRQVQLSLKVLF